MTTLRRAARSVVVAIPVIIASPVLVLAIQGYMFLPVGLFLAIYSPWSPFVRFPQTKWLVTHTIWMTRDLRMTLFHTGWALIGAGLVIFLFAYAYFYSIKYQIFRKNQIGLVTSGPYRVVRHPQYLGIFMGLTGFVLVGVRPIAVLAWITAACTYLALMVYEESENERRFGDEWRAWRDRTPFIIPLFPRRLARPLGRLFGALPRPAQYLALAALYLTLMAGAIAFLRDRSFPT
jgi:protein-S-isoprenylcysteine O-methyltransferase Ste14